MSMLLSRQKMLLIGSEHTAVTILILDSALTVQIGPGTVDGNDTKSWVGPCNHFQTALLLLRIHTNFSVKTFSVNIFVTKNV